MGKNLHKFYYKDYYDNAGFRIETNASGEAEIKGDEKNIPNGSFIKEANQKYLDDARKTFDKIDDSLVGENHFSLTVQYPGLITGIGIRHEAKITGEFKLGIHLDYTSGLPVIYGSTVKGVLRSAFKEKNLLDIIALLVEDNRQQIEALRDKLSISNVSMDDLARDIFGNDNDNDEDRSIYCRDIFLDAYVEDLNGSPSMLTADSITPHKGGLLKDPVPLTFVRITSGCTIRFRFKLVRSQYISIEDKLLLFRSILIAFGIGAKTNVGYGRLG